MHEFDDIPEPLLTVLKIAARVAARMRPGDEDFRQESILAALRAFPKHDEAKGKLSSFVWLCAERALLNVIAAENRHPAGSFPRDELGEEMPLADPREPDPADNAALETHPEAAQIWRSNNEDGEAQETGQAASRLVAEAANPAPAEDNPSRRDADHAQG